MAEHCLENNNLLFAFFITLPEQKRRERERRKKGNAFQSPLCIYFHHNNTPVFIDSIAARHSYVNRTYDSNHYLHILM